MGSGQIERTDLARSGSNVYDGVAHAQRTSTVLTASQHLYELDLEAETVAFPILAVCVNGASHKLGHTYRTSVLTPWFRHYWTRHRCCGIVRMWFNFSLGVFCCCSPGALRGETLLPFCRCWVLEGESLLPFCCC